MLGRRSCRSSNRLCLGEVQHRRDAPYLGGVRHCDDHGHLAFQGASRRVVTPAMRRTEHLAVPPPLQNQAAAGPHYRLITDEGVAVGGAFDSDTATGMMPVAHRVAGVGSFRRP